jgi:DNA-directed RNA polymerase beta subunit
MDSNVFSKYSRNLQNISPCELSLTVENNKFIELVQTIGVSKNLKNIFDNWIFDGSLERHISFEKLQITHGIITFSNIKVNKPIFEHKGNILNLTPRIARENDLTYSGSIEIDITFTPHDTNYKPVIKRLNIGNMPIMLGTRLCHLYNKTPEEIIKMGECPNDPLGYFIISGTEKIINIQEKVRALQVITRVAKNILRTEITCPYPAGSSTIALAKNKYYIYELTVPTEGNIGKQNSLFVIFDVLLNNILPTNTIENIIEYSMNLILKYTDEKYKLQIKYLLNLSKIDAKSKFSEDYRFYEYLMNNRKLGKLITDDEEIEIKTSNQKYNENMRNYTYKTLKLELDQSINRELFKHIYSKTSTLMEEKLEKANLLAYMVANNCQCELGKEPDSVDNWVNKRLETAGRSMKDLFTNTIFKKFLKEAEKNIDLNFTNTSANFNNTFSTNFITSEFVVNFGPNKWGSPMGKKNAVSYANNITDNMKRETSMSVISQIGRINTPRNSRTKDTNIRSLQNTQLGYICCSETPEGEKCGLAKNIALTTHVSLERDIFDFEEIIKDLREKGYISQNSYDDPTSDTETVLIGNGRIYGWCNKDIVSKILKENKILGNLPFDCCIYYNSYNKVLEYNCDSSRILRPLLIINQKTENLIIDENNMWDKSIDDLYKLGAMELIDSRQQDDITISMSIDIYRKLIEDKKNIFSEKEKNKKQRLKTINNKNYEHFRVFNIYNNLVDEIIKEISTFLKKNSNDYIKNIINFFDYSNKVLLSKFLDYKLTDFSELIQSYDNMRKNEESYNILRNEYKIDDKIDEYKLEIYTHCELDPISIFGIASSLIPKSDSNQGPRTVYQASMCKQALGPYHYNKHLRFDTNFKTLNNPQRPIFENFLSETFGLNIMPTGQNPIVAYLALDANNEDAIVAKQEYFDAGNCSYTKYFTIRYESQNTSNEFFKIPENIPEIIKHKYHAIQENGLPRLGAEIKQNDVILGKITIDSNNIQNETSITAKKGEDGVIDRILVSKNSEGTTIFRIKIRQKRKIIPGDKLASRYSQKGTIGKILPSYQLPRISSGPNKGLVPDFFINPNSSISRMTQGKFKEFLCSKGAIYNNSRIDASPFHPEIYQPIYKILQENGDIYGDETMEHPNGMKLKCKVFIAPCNYQCLKHHVLDKIQIRGGGIKYNYEDITRQPTKGRNVVGGLRSGEMERDSFISHGSSAILLDRMMVCSDRYLTSFCKTCGNMAISDVVIKQSICKVCGECADIGTVKMCYIFKLIIDMVHAIGINIKLKLKNAYNKDNRYEEKFLT